MGFFSSFRERKRLAASEKFWRSEARRYEQEVWRLNALLLSQAMVFSDRICTTIGKTFAVSDEIKVKAVTIAEPVETPEQRYIKARDKYLATKKAEMDEKVNEAIAAGIATDVETEFAKYKPMYLAEFDAQFFPGGR